MSCRYLRSFMVARSRASRSAAAHCDTTQGPVVTAARALPEADDPDLVLRSHAEARATAEAHGRGRLPHLPWPVTGRLAIVPLIEAASLTRRRRPAAASSRAGASLAHHHDYFEQGDTQRAAR